MVLKNLNTDYPCSFAIIGLLLSMVTILTLGCGSAARSSEKPSREMDDKPKFSKPAGTTNIDKVVETDPDLDKNRKRWRESKIVNYEMSVRIHFSSYTTPAEPVIIKVRDGKSISIAPEFESDKRDIKVYEKYDTIEKIFAEIESEIRAKNTVKVKYNKLQGYPENTTIFANDSDSFRSIAVVGLKLNTAL